MKKLKFFLALKTQSFLKPDLKKSLALFFLVLFAHANISVAFGSGNADARNSAISKTLVKGARDVLLLGYNDTAMELLTEALTFSPADSDANYLLALLEYNKGIPFYKIIERLELAFLNKSFQFYTSNDAYSFYASLLAKTGRAGEALARLSVLPVNPENLYTKTIASLNTGNIKEAEKAVLDAISLFPADARAVIAFLSFADNKNYQALTEAAFATLPLVRENYPDLLVLLANVSSSDEEARLLLREYRAKGYSSPQATLLALNYGLISETKAIEEAFSATYIPVRKTLEALYKLLYSDEARYLFNDSFKNYSGYLFDRISPDGRPSIVSVYKNGKLESWTMDTALDGQPDYELSFSSGFPDVYVHHSAMTSIKLKYSTWPYLEEALFSDASAYREYYFAPKAILYKAVEFYSISDFQEGPYFVEPAEADVFNEKMASIAAYKARRSEAKTKTELAVLNSGELISSLWLEHDRTKGYSYFNAENIKVDYIDNDADGRFEGRRIWAIDLEGKLVEQYIELDTDGDGIYEYRESSSAGVIKSWDYDGDGIVDLVIKDEADGKKIYSFFFENKKIIEAIYKQGKLLGVSENGISIPLIPDSNKKIIWLGHKAFDFGLKQPQAGYGIQNRLVYRVFLVNDIYYVQIIE